jgi:lysophospholipid acyltransferase (LPLAT)-like uncharacterized protein
LGRETLQSIRAFQRLEQEGNQAAGEYLREMLDMIARGSNIAAAADMPKSRRASLIREAVRKMRRGDI